MANFRQANNRKATRGRIKQAVMSEPSKIFVKRIITKKGKRLLEEGTISQETAEFLYGKNKYRKNPNAVPIRMITHVV